MENFPDIEAFSELHPLSAECKKDFASIIQIQSLSKNTMLLDFGKKANSLFFIKKGLARAYYNRNGILMTAVPGIMIWKGQPGSFFPCCYY